MTSMCSEAAGGFTGILLCGGRSRRMGRDKAALTLGGRTFLEIQAQKLRSQGARDLLLSGGTAELPGTRLVPDVYPDRGPLGGLHACLGEAAWPDCLVLSVDVPLVPLEALEGLLAAHREQGADVTLLEGPNGVEPLIAVYRRELTEVIGALIARGPAPVRALLEQVRTVCVPYTGDLARLNNCNTPEDYRDLCRLFEQIQK